ncbi:hypothetical protein [Bradyrhizobium japonicum]|uniref:hypothetical protein n=1 Tax=Bradyrhizobium japonicum TaxID=375 RepID=UPI0028974549|nr:hypothetical protein [Bradyrhizobium japonicum]
MRFTVFGGVATGAGAAITAGAVAVFAIVFAGALFFAGGLVLAEALAGFLAIAVAETFLATTRFFATFLPAFFDAFAALFFTLFLAAAFFVFLRALDARAFAAFFAAFFTVFLAAFLFLLLLPLAVFLARVATTNSFCRLLKNLETNLRQVAVLRMIVSENRSALSRIMLQRVASASQPNTEKTKGLRSRL